MRQFAPLTSAHNLLIIKIVIAMTTTSQILWWRFDPTVCAMAFLRAFLFIVLFLQPAQAEMCLAPGSVIKDIGEAERMRARMDLEAALKEFFQVKTGNPLPDALARIEKAARLYWRDADLCLQENRQLGALILRSDATRGFAGSILVLTPRKETLATDMQITGMILGNILPGSRERVGPYLARRYGVQSMPLILKSGPVERPAAYEYDQGFWDKAEKANPGLLEKVKKIIATYFDETTNPLMEGQVSRVPLKEGEDYDFISGRCVVLTLAAPVAMGGVQMMELVLKGPAFKKSEEDKEFYPTDDRSEANIALLKERGGHYEFDEAGNVTFGKEVFTRLNACLYIKAKTEYDMGRHCFNNPRAPVNMLPVLNALYVRDKGAKNAALGVVVIANPVKTVHFHKHEDGRPIKNRVGDVSSLFYFKLLEFAQSDEYAQIKSKVYESTKELATGFGHVLRSFHDAGYIHGNPHSGNAAVDMDTNEVTMVDLTDAKIKSGEMLEQAFGYQLRDIDYVTSNLTMRLRMRHDERLRELVMHFIRYFLIGYLDEFGNRYRDLPDEEILRDIQGLEGVFPQTLTAQGSDRGKIYSPTVLRNPLASLVARIVFPPAGQGVPMELPDPHDALLETSV